jgi:hypothetical protein
MDDPKIPLEGPFKKIYPRQDNTRIFSRQGTLDRLL